MRYLLMTVLLGWGTLLFAQYPSMKNVHFGQVDMEDLVVDYALFGDTTQQLPLMLYCTGSLPYPLFISQGADTYSTLPFSFPNYAQRCHILVVSKPGIPLVAEASQLNEQQLFVDPSTGKPPRVYLDRNHLEYMTELNLIAIETVAQSPWVAEEPMLISGHSAGARIATMVMRNTSIATHLGYMSCEPTGRFYEMLRLSAQSKERPDRAVMDQLAYWKEIIQDPEGGQDLPDPHFTTFTNSLNMIGELFELERPIWAAYGTADVKTEGMLAIPYEFIRAGKENLTFVPYAHGDHSFFEVGENGQPNYNAYHFEHVFQDMLAWWLEGKTEFETDLSQRK